MSFKLSGLFDGYRARLSRQVVIWIFASFVLIEAIVLVPSYYRRRGELYNQIEEVSGAIVESVARLTVEKTSDSVLLEKVKKLTKNSVILGASLYRSDGVAIATFGELPALSFADLKATDMVRRWDGNRYDVAWSARYLGVDYSLIARHDASSIQKELYAFTFRIAGLVLLISGFVTSVTTFVLGVTVIVPILRLRDDLLAAGDALSKENANFDFYSFSVKRQDELGEVMEAFRQMFCRVEREIAQRKQAEEIQRAEQEKSERLLLNILPKAIADRLKQGQSTIAQQFTSVTILFADLVGFTQLSAEISPEKLVAFLNEIFSAFDRLTDRYDLEKIKTIGDAYMVVGGLPVPRSDSASAVAEMALDMLQEIAAFNAKRGSSLSLRIGINTGPVIAGVIGTKKFIYDLWGDAVNTASRMESHGTPGAIQVTVETYELLRDKYAFEERGVIHVKGKGEMTTYWLVGRMSK